MSFTQALYEHVQTLKAEDARAQQQAQLADSESLAGEEETALAMREVTRRGGIERTYNLDQNIQICGPFGSSFSRCFNMHRQRGQHERSAYDIVILYGSGLGVPSALAALSEYFERRRDGTQVPQFVHFLWQARFPQDLLLCWDSLHRLIFEAGGLWSKELWAAQRQTSSRGIPLDRREHRRRNHGTEWSAESELLEWLGVALHVSQMDKQQPKAGAATPDERTTAELYSGREGFERDNPLAGVDERVHQWLVHPDRLRSGYHRLGEQVVRLVAQYYEVNPQAKPPKICVSMCGSHKMLEKTREHLKRAQSAIRDELGIKVRIACELAVDSQGSGGGGAPPKPKVATIAPADSHDGASPKGGQSTASKLARSLTFFKKRVRGRGKAGQLESGEPLPRPSHKEVEHSERRELPPSNRKKVTLSTSAAVDEPGGKGDEPPAAVLQHEKSFTKATPPSTKVRL